MHGLFAFCNIKAQKPCLSQIFEIVMILSVAEEKSAFAANLKRLRESRGLSQKALGGTSGISYRTIQNVEAGVSDFGVGELIALAEELDVSIDELVRDNPKVKPRKPTPQEALEVLREAIEQPASKLPAPSLVEFDLTQDPDVVALLNLLKAHPKAVRRVLRRARAIVEGLNDPKDSSNTG